MGSYSVVGGLFVSSGFQHLTLGGAGFGGMLPTCRRWSPSSTEKCESTVVAGASAQLKNGSIVIGGNDYRTPWYPPGPGKGVATEGTFVLRGTDGVERQIPGDPGSRTGLMIAERHHNAAWAVTVVDRPTGPVFTLQRYEG
ncbi:MAG: hypothetical protein IPK37_08650 [Austwickia sp.]|jgi:hypothetical protein|nr:MAG: hypothetical protein IPK37_08650 [Austwickia sp.]